MCVCEHVCVSVLLSSCCPLQLNQCAAHVPKGTRACCPHGWAEPPVGSTRVQLVALYKITVRAEAHHNEQCVRLVTLDNIRVRSESSHKKQSAFVADSRCAAE